MAAKELKNIFLSASIPLPERDPKYYKTADIIAIRDSVIALATVVLPVHRLIWGGHQSITPLIYYVMEKLDINIQEHLILFQSKFFEKYFPKDNDKFKNVIQTENLGEKDRSLALMREIMFRSYKFSAGIFIGGMEGVEREFAVFRDYQPEALIIPLASTGAAAKIIFDQQEFDNEDFLNNYAYASFFQNNLLI